jgi:hypothetical protein
MNEYGGYVCGDGPVPFDPDAFMRAVMRKRLLPKCEELELSDEEVTEILQSMDPENMQEHIFQDNAAMEEIIDAVPVPEPRQIDDGEYGEPELWDDDDEE